MNLLFEINQVRVNPLDYCYKIKAASKFITPLTSKEISESRNYENINSLNSFFSENWKKNSKYKLSINDICNIALSKGNKNFMQIYESIKLMNPLHEFLFREDLCLNISDNIKEWTKREIISSQLNGIEKLNKYSKIAFHYDLGVKNDVLSVILQLVDDSPFRGNRRNNILTSDYDCVGISVKIVNDIICTYYVFGKEKSKDIHTITEEDISDQDFE